ncbi:hypothetical protein NM688_g7626 [Phlebia brevispora]|uniref:Uncharacterized protein n=1 Tax=Phlebia brevispora TaxID=194682 RepID=A0ACC1S328_9APHY|nr:hypothetical protein NM688_g7626 [Phlebia brevispora]
MRRPAPEPRAGHHHLTTNLRKQTVDPIRRSSFSSYPTENHEVILRRKRQIPPFTDIPSGCHLSIVDDVGVCLCYCSVGYPSGVRASTPSRRAPSPSMRLLPTHPSELVLWTSRAFLTSQSRLPLSQSSIYGQSVIAKLLWRTMQRLADMPLKTGR